MEETVIKKKNIFKNNLSGLYFKKEERKGGQEKEREKEYSSPNRYVDNPDNSFANYVLHIC